MMWSGSENLFVLHLRAWRVIALMLIVVIPAARAATSNAPAYSVRIWQTDDGLPQNSVHAIAQTDDGYLWVGTHEGLARFDGVRFTMLDEKFAPELKHSWITALCTSKDGSLWIACDGLGVLRLRHGAISRFAETNGLPNNQTRCLLETRDGSIWIGSEGGLTRFKDGKLTTFSDKSGLGDNSVRAIHEDVDGNLRIATRRGLSTMNREGFLSTLNLGLGMVGNALKCIWVDRAGRIWTGSNEGLNCLDGERRTFFSVGEGLPDRVTTVLYGDRQGQIWIGTYGGLAIAMDQKAISVPVLDVAPGERINAIFQDREENIWIGTWDGLCRLTPARFSTFAAAQGLTCNNVMSVYEDRRGAIWLGTWGGGLNELRNGKIRAYGTSNGLTHDFVLSLHETHDGSMWIGMEYGGGLNRIRDSHRNQFVRQAGLTNSQIRVLHEDRLGTLWIGTTAGLKALKQNRLATYSTDQGLAGNWVMAIHEDAQTNLWFGTDGGLSRWDGSTFSNYTTQEGLSHNNVNAIYADAEGTLWIGTKGGGLNRFRDGKFTAYTSRQGLFSDEIYEILEDDSGFFWMSCRKGIFRVSRSELDALDRGERRTINGTAYGRADGLVSVQCNGVAKPAGWKGADGRLWFATICGAVAVESKIKTNRRPPPVVIEEVLADQKHFPVHSLSANGDIMVEIPAGRGEVEIHYTALSFQAPEKNRFKYRLDDVDEGWNEAGTSRTAHYNNLSPGNYRFQVVASNNDGVWNDAGAALVFVIQPHAWQTWWFKAAIIAATGGMLGLFYRTRVRRLREIESLRIRIAADLHDDVGSRLTKVAMVTESVDAETSAADRVKPHIQNIARTTREIIQAMDEIVWTINPKNDTLDNLANYIFQYAQDFFQDSHVRCRMDLPARLPERTLSTEQRHNIFMVVKEALTNVVKHANATEVRIGLASAGNELIITVADNGRGFATNPLPNSGDGLQNMKQRLERIGGRLVLESHPGAGTEITLEAPT
jgi:ligand-binding sensor domain-containing protein/two-component sensor histidine kinase